VLKPVLICAGLGLAVAGCYTPLPKKDSSAAADWSEPGVATNHVAPPPVSNRVARVSQPASAPAKPAPETGWVPLRRWTAEHGLLPPQRVASLPVDSFAVVSPRGVFAVQAGSTSAHWRGMELRLGFKPQLMTDGSDVLIHALDLRKNLEPLLTGAWAMTNSTRVLVIDPGHGGANFGTCSPNGGGCEKTFTLDWALRVAHLLTTNGWTVHLTRTNDVEVSLPARVELAEALHADLFISLHFNHSGGGSEPAGVETYCLTPVGMESTLTRGYPDDPRERLPNNAFDAENLRLAARIHQELIAVEGTRDRAIRRARFQTVLRGQNRPAVLVEGGFLSNQTEARRIADPKFRQHLAEAVARALTP
jgi:N-acetylmuramoyl-L-alanine amidase